MLLEQSSKSSARMGWCLFIKRLNRAFEFDRQRIAFAINLFTHRHLDPAFADAVFLHIKALFVVEFDAYIMLKNSRDVKWAAGVGAEVVGQGWFRCERRCGFGHGKILEMV